MVLEAYHRVRQSLGVIHIDNSRKEKQQKWTLPPKDVFKINVDVATSSKDQKVGLAAVITNSNGKSAAEAEAIEWGFQVAKEAALSSLIIELECQEVVELINNTNGSITAVHWIISKIQHHKRDFPTVKFLFVPRNCNAHAHSFAKFALGKDASAVWKETIPPNIHNVV